MKTIILDTSFLLTALKRKIDIFSELNRIIDTPFTLAIIDKTLLELKGKPLESLAKTFLSKNNATIIPTHHQGNVDSLILANLAPHTMVATQDRKLKERLKKRKTTLITIRQQRYLMIV